jgi:hypothetical protein
LNMLELSAECRHGPPAMPWGPAPVHVVAAKL